MGTNPRDPVVLIRSNPLERVDPDVIERVRERMKRIRTGPYIAAASPSKAPSDDPPDDVRESNPPQ